MNYSIVPKNNTSRLPMSSVPVPAAEAPVIARSAVRMLRDRMHVLNALKEANRDIVTSIQEAFHTCRFVHSSVHNSTLSVSKLCPEPECALFFELSELFQLFNLHDLLSSPSPLSIWHQTPHPLSSQRFFNQHRPPRLDRVHVHVPVRTERNEENAGFSADIMVIEFPSDVYESPLAYTQHMVHALQLLLRHLRLGGVCVWKIGSLVHPSLLDVVYIVANCFDKTLLCKPTVSSVLSGEKYLVCKSFCPSLSVFESALLTLSPHTMGTQQRLLDMDLPLYVLTKLEEIELIALHQQLDAVNQIINLFKHRNREEKLEAMRKANIQKSIQWCEKHRVPHNKFIERVNLFLSA